MTSFLRVSSLILLMVAAAGCGGQDALEMRQRQFAYTPEKLADELVRRLEKVHKASAQTRRRQRAPRAVAIENRDRGVDPGDRPDPLSRDVFVKDVTHKIRLISEGGSPQETLRKVIDLLRSRQGVNPKDIDWLEQAVANKLKATKE